MAGGSYVYDYATGRLFLYDGAVFDVGYASLDTVYDMEDEYGYHYERYYTMDQLPNYLRDEPCYYFTYTNQ